MVTALMIRKHQKKNRALCVEVLGSVSSLGQRQILIAGDWNFEPCEMPIDLILGSQVVRPLSDEAATAPKGEEVKLDWFLTYKTFAPACGMEEAKDLKPDHVAVRFLLKLERFSPGFRRCSLFFEVRGGYGFLVELLYLKYPEKGALDETFDVAYLTEERSAAGQHQPGVFLDCSKCYERVPLRVFEEFAIESGYPLYALNVALNMYSGAKRILVQGAISEGVTATCGLPPGCGHVVDMLHAFVIKSVRCAGRQVEVR
eukprot:205460-Amphidinium_carterae.1